MMSDAAWTALAAIALAAINMVGSVLNTWIRAYYHIPPTESNGGLPQGRKGASNGG